MKILTQINKIKRFVAQHNTPTVGTFDNASSSRSVSNNLKMPMFDLPKFDGKYENWKPFHEQFMASVDSNASLPNIQKFNYLKSALTGEASQLISHLPLSNSNYQIALNSLTDRYDNPRLIVKTHIRAIFQLKPLQKESATKLGKLIVAFEENLMAMQALKVDTIPSGFVWVDLLSEKLDAESRRQFELDYPGKDLQTLDQLREFINRGVQALEVSESRTPQSSFNNIKSSQEHRKSRESNHASQNYKISTERCPACSENYNVYSCDKFKILSIQERKNIVFTAKLSFNCLNSGHTTKYCKSKSACRTCKGRHNSLLHVASNTLSSNSTQKGVINVTAYILPTLTQFIPSSEFSIQTNHLRSIKLADPNFNKPGRIEMILGSDVFEEVVLDGKFTAENRIHFRNTVLGWIASGKHPESQPTNSKITSSVCILGTGGDTPSRDTNSRGVSM